MCVFTIKNTSAAQIITQAVSPLLIEYPDVGVVGLSIPPNVELSGILKYYYATSWTKRK